MKYAAKNLRELTSEDLEKVSGGYVDYHVFSKAAFCDKCRKKGVYPINGGHHCEDCIKKFDNLCKNLSDKTLKVLSLPKNKNNN